MLKEHTCARFGWLHPNFPYAKGDVPTEFLARLKEFVARSGQSAEALYFGAFGGIHTCEFCGRAHGIQNFGVPSDNLLFVAPEMVLHYIQEHGYCPPPEFVSAVLRSPLPGTDGYDLVTEPFWHMHRQAIESTIDAAEKDKPRGSP